MEDVGCGVRAVSDGETPDESITVSEIEDATAPASAGPRRRGPNWFR